MLIPIPIMSPQIPPRLAQVLENPVTSTVLGITHQLSINRQSPLLTVKTTEQMADHGLDQKTPPEHVKPMAPDRPVQGVCTSTRITTHTTRLLRTNMCMGNLSQNSCPARKTPWFCSMRQMFFVHRMPQVDGQNKKRTNDDLTKMEIERAATSFSRRLVRHIGLLVDLCSSRLPSLDLKSQRPARKEKAQRPQRKLKSCFLRGRSLSQRRRLHFAPCQHAGMTSRLTGQISGCQPKSYVASSRGPIRPLLSNQATRTLLTHSQIGV